MLKTVLKSTALQSNLLIVEVIKEEQVHSSGLILNTRKIQGLGKVIQTGKLTVFPEATVGSLVLFDISHLEQAPKLDREFQFTQEKTEYRLLQEYAIQMVVETIEIEVPDVEQPADGNSTF